MKRYAGMLFSLLVFFTLGAAGYADTDKEYDVVVYGDSSAALTATIAAKRDGRRVVLVNEEGFVRREGVIWRTPPGPYGIAYRSITPKSSECENLLVPVCLSASHVAHGSIRMEPVFMGLGEAASIAADLAIDTNVSVQGIDYARLRDRLERSK